MVAEGKINTIEDTISCGLPIKEPEIVDFLMGEMDKEVLSIDMVQRMTDSGRRVKFRVVVAIGNRDGLIGIGQAKDAQVSSTIRKATNDAKLSLHRIRRGCGSWECDCDTEHSVPFEVTGKSGSVRVTLKPAPKGIGLACGSVPRRILELAGIKDVWTMTKGDTRTTLNFAKATYDALKKTTTLKG